MFHELKSRDIFCKATVLYFQAYSKEVPLSFAKRLVLALALFRVTHRVREWQAIKMALFSRLFPRIQSCKPWNSYSIILAGLWIGSRRLGTCVANGHGASIARRYAGS